MKQIVDELTISPPHKKIAKRSRLYAGASLRFQKNKRKGTGDGNWYRHKQDYLRDGFWKLGVEQIRKVE